VILVRQVPSELDPEDEEALQSLEAGLIEGVRDSGVPAVAVERSDAEPSMLGAFSSRDVSTVDDVDLAAGKVAMVFALLGAAGDFGVKESADSLLPELLQPVPEPPPEQTPTAPPARTAPGR
jgi:hypothetical protein